MLQECGLPARMAAKMAALPRGAGGPGRGRGGAPPTEGRGDLKLNHYPFGHLVDCTIKPAQTALNDVILDCSQEAQVKTMTIRNVPAELASALDAERRRRGLSLNRTVLSLMQEALGISTSGSRSNGLRHLAGAWNAEEFRQFEEAVAPFGEIDLSPL